MFKKLFKKSAPIEIIAPMSGQVVSLTDVPDPVFGERMMGEGAAIIPSEGKVVAPVNGKIVQIPDSKHAIGIETEDGVEVLIHVGLETVSLKGAGFQALAAVGDQVRVGDPILEVDLAYIEEHADNIITPIVITNTDKEKSYQDASGITSVAGETVILTIS
ncbi:PTS sugar transporter subunit IIA [Gracilibacillus alcaliphilus]|uniref:PTS sugar transporter subunit IIA n=1 Tax=Gracilibacillus alcaliphilus TaxID=1401441 RepID=UPI0019584859|nr:PTS glucose transporter subunit IIA [Gracilibacillus alcaliphilus]MBM7679460.1 PTS system glucose-specific IIA component [Gracilibacillus alcaliphilus]